MKREFWEAVLEDLKNVSDEEWNSFVNEFDKKHIGDARTIEISFAINSLKMEKEVYSLEESREYTIAA